jgi:2-dehydro-3-deoxy-D-gluconate 5-dehydrogenase
MAAEKRFTPITELISLSNKKALVTGGAMGIGFAIAYRLAEAGAMVTIADLNEEKGQKAVQDLNGRGFQVFFTRCDVSKEEEIKNTVNSAVEKMGGLDILVNNAGIFPFKLLAQTSGDDFEKVLAVNLKGLFNFCREASQRMIAQKRTGCIVNIASVDSLHPSNIGLSAYDASKGGVLMLTRSLARELAANGIRVNAIAPGGIMTEGVIAQSAAQTTGAGQDSREVIRAFLSRIPLGKMGMADDIGRVALFLASDLSSYMTGSLVVVDGGYLLS